MLCSEELTSLQNTETNGCAWSEVHPAHHLVSVRRKQHMSRGRGTFPEYCCSIRLRKFLNFILQNVSV